MPFVINSPTCSRCGRPPAECRCRPAANQRPGVFAPDESKLLPFDQPAAYLGRDGEPVSRPSQEAADSPDGLAAFGLPSAYIPVPQEKK